MRSFSLAFVALLIQVVFSNFLNPGVMHRSKRDNIYVENLNIECKDSSSKCGVHEHNNNAGTGKYFCCYSQPSDRKFLNLMKFLLLTDSLNQTFEIVNFAYFHEIQILEKI